MENETVQFECLFNKDISALGISWYKDGIKIENGDEKGRIQIVNENEKQILIIKDAKLDDTANYEIKIGNVKSAASLKVKGILKNNFLDILDLFENLM